MAKRCTWCNKELGRKVLEDKGDLFCSKHCLDLQLKDDELFDQNNEKEQLTEKNKMRLYTVTFKHRVTDERHGRQTVTISANNVVWAINKFFNWLQSQQIIIEDIMWIEARENNFEHIG